MSLMGYGYALPRHVNHSYACSAIAECTAQGCSMLFGSHAEEFLACQAHTADQLHSFKRLSCTACGRVIDKMQKTVYADALSTMVISDTLTVLWTAFAHIWFTYGYRGSPM